MKSLAFLLATLLISTSVFSSPTFVHGFKYSNDKEDDSILHTKALLPDEDSYRGGFNKLLPYVSLAPYQDGAGSCLFMSHTGAVELLLNKKYKSHFDLSERYFMNLKQAGIGNELLKNWRVDTIFRLNATKKIYLNKDYKFSKGYYKIINGERAYATATDPQAKYGTKWNWIVDFDSLEQRRVSPVILPHFDREVLFEDPSENQWNVGTAPADIVEKVKAALVKRESPVEVIYNHHGFWHAVIVVGFNDQANSHGCSFVRDFQDRMNKRSLEIKEEAYKLPVGEAQDKLLRKARNFRRKGQKVNDNYLRRGGCREKGVFYVRDSIYPSERQALYDYDSSKEGEEAYLNEPVILRSFEWLEQLGNNIVQIYIK